MDNHKNNTAVDATQSRGAFLFSKQNQVANLIVKGGDYNCNYTAWQILVCNHYLLFYTNKDWGVILFALGVDLAHTLTKHHCVHEKKREE